MKSTLQYKVFALIQCGMPGVIFWPEWQVKIESATIFLSRHIQLIIFKMIHKQWKPVPVTHHSSSAYTEKSPCFYLSSHPLLSLSYKLEIGTEKVKKKEPMTLTYSTLRNCLWVLLFL